MFVQALLEGSSSRPAIFRNLNVDCVNIFCASYVGLGMSLPLRLLGLIMVLLLQSVSLTIYLCFVAVVIVVVISGRIPDVAAVVVDYH